MAFLPKSLGFMKNNNLDYKLDFVWGYQRNQNLKISLEEKLP